MNSSSSSISTSSSFSDVLEPSLSQTLTTSHSSSSSSSSSSSLTTKKSMFKGGVISSAGAPSPRSVMTSMFCYDSLSDDEPRHFLDSCFLCNKALSGHKDIFMYGGDKPFCSEDCRKKQMDFDEKKEQEEIKMKLKMKSFYSSSSIKSLQRSSLIINEETANTAAAAAVVNQSFWT